MIDLKLLRNKKDYAASRIAARGMATDLEAVLSADADRMSATRELEEMRKRMNEESAKIGLLAREGKDISARRQDLKKLSAAIKEKESVCREIEERFNSLVLFVPNLPDESVPEGASEEENVEIRKWGEPRKFSFEPKSHVEIGENLGILDFKRAAKMSGARFALYRGPGARLERALISFMLNSHGANGYEEVITPFMVNRQAMTGTGQLPKFEDDLFRLEGLDMFLIPTAEVSVTNIYAGEILSAGELPRRFCAYTPCFRKEAGSYGKIATGLIRQHQFNKVELVKLSRPEDSMAELESLTADAELILQKLELPYRVVELCTGDLGFSAAKTYDLEVWLPSQNRYVEISSCSNFGDFQARRLGIRFRREINARPELVHTINGSGLAIGRALVAILENYQNENGSVEIPKTLRHYMMDSEIIEKV